MKETPEKTEELCKNKNTIDALLGGVNECIPALSKCLELKCSENMGRGVYTTCDINPGIINYYIVTYFNTIVLISNT